MAKRHVKSKSLTVQSTTLYLGILRKSRSKNAKQQEKVISFFRTLKLALNYFVFEVFCDKTVYF